MAYVLTSHETRETPAEYDSNNLIRCATCGTDHDYEDDDKTFTKHRFGEGFVTIDEEHYCTAVCYPAAKEKAYRIQAAAILLAKLEEAAEEIGDLEKELPDAEEAPDSPLCLIDDLRDRLPKYAEGKDSGWRRGLMLDREEASDFKWSVAEVISSLSISLKVSIDLAPEIKADPYFNARLTRNLCKLGGVLATFNEVEQRGKA